MTTIAIDYTPAHEQGAGIGRYVRDLIGALARVDSTTDYRLFVAGRGPLPTLPGPNFRWRFVPLQPVWLARLWHRAQLPLPVETFTGAVALYHATDFVLPPVRHQTRTLLTVHDLSYVRVPETTSPRLKAYLDRVVPDSVRRADHVLADSQATKDDLIALYGTDPAKITVLLSGVDPRFRSVNDVTVRSRYRIGDRPYLFSVGTVQPRKNYSRLIRVLARLRADGIDVDLVIAGGRGWLEDEMYTTLRECGMSDHVHLIGFAADQDLPALYTQALCTAFPSLYEGFGFPVLESMACGTPVLTSSVSSLPEVAGDAALLVDPVDQEALYTGLKRLIEDSTVRETLRTRGYQQAKQFTWERSAQQLQAVYRQLLL